jgi:phage baseplate assembly protein W
MSDIRIYTLTGVYEGTTKDSEYMVPTPLSDTVTTPLETICGKVVKFLLTSKGSHAMNQEYGSYLTTYTQISESFLPRLHIELLDDISRCASYIKQAEKALQSDYEKLARITLKSLDYKRHTRDRIDIHIEVVTTKRNSALLTVPVDLA